MSGTKSTYSDKYRDRDAFKSQATPIVTSTPKPKAKFRPATPGGVNLRTPKQKYVPREDPIEISDDSSTSPSPKTRKRRSPFYAPTNVKRPRTESGNVKENIFVDNKPIHNVSNGKGKVSARISAPNPPRLRAHIPSSTDNFLDAKSFDSVHLDLRLLNLVQLRAIKKSNYRYRAEVDLRRAGSEEMDEYALNQIYAFLGNRLDAIEAQIQILQNTSPLPSPPSPSPHPHPRAPYLTPFILQPSPVRTQPESSQVSPNSPSCIGPSSDTVVDVEGEIYEKLRNQFGLDDFRPNQREAILATLSGRDVYVLMPTGGGKSLCFQLPAICTMGKTQGVTVVVSPLIALMANQVDSLLKKNIDVILWNSESRNREEIKQRLLGHSKPSLLYISPEKIKDSYDLGTIFKHLRDQGFLARFVIDEAHCISTWGQDFREAYSLLSCLRDEYPGVPIMALTATATLDTSADIINNLRLEKPLCLSQSFNRANLTYTVIKKTPSTVQEQIAKYIKENYEGKCGIVYCIAKRRVEQVATYLVQQGLKAKHYHADLPVDERSKTRADWQTGVCDIIVATIAFGMGIDKPDVRFVIHHDIPNTIEAFYQETGRAGRDGEHANCVLYYNFNDYHARRNMITHHQSNEERNKRLEITKRQMIALRKVVEYCENQSQCRRAFLLSHFDEISIEDICQGTCDVCSNDTPVEDHDVTQLSREVVKLVEWYLNQTPPINLSETVARDIFRGSISKSVTEKRGNICPQHGIGKALPLPLTELLFRKLVCLEYIEFVTISNPNSIYTANYLVLGRKAGMLINGDATVNLQYRPSGPNSTKRSRKHISRAPVASQVIQEAPLYDNDDIDDELDALTPTTYTPAPSQSTMSSENVDDVVMILYDELRQIRDRGNFVWMGDEILYLLSTAPPRDTVGYIELLNDYNTDKAAVAQSVKVFLTPCISHRKRHKTAYSA